MRIEFRSQGIEESGRLRRRVEHRLRKSLRRLAHRVQELRVSVRDVNGPKGGVDTELQLEARLAGARTVRITERNLNPEQALAHGTRRVRQAIGRTLSRKPSRGRVTPAAEEAA